jgi:hypothetical protein
MLVEGRYCCFDRVTLLHSSEKSAERDNSCAAGRLANSLWANRKVAAVVLVENASKHRRRVKVRQAELGDRSRNRDQRRGSPARLDLNDEHRSRHYRTSERNAHVADQGMVGQVGVARLGPLTAAKAHERRPREACRSAPLLGSSLEAGQGMWVQARQAGTSRGWSGAAGDVGIEMTRREEKLPKQIRYTHPLLFGLTTIQDTLAECRSCRDRVG